MAFSMEESHKLPGMTNYNDSFRRQQRMDLARKLRSKQNNFESEVSLCESDLHQFYLDCEKDPQHANFHPVDQFSFGDLPSKYQKMSLYLLIKSLVFLTVRVDVKCKRSYQSGDTNLCSLESYLPAYVRYGTGRIYEVSKCTSSEKTKCPCPQCKIYTPAAEWLKIKIITAKHIVFDTVDAANTTCKLGFNNYESNAKSFDGIWAENSPSLDWCKLTCVTHDVGIFGQLKDELAKYDKYAKEIYEKYRLSGVKDKFVIIVSHPHGCRKQISFGYWCTRDQLKGIDISFTYTTSTCNGSSGATVFIVGRDGRLGLYNHVHSGCKPRIDQKKKVEDLSKTYNFSCFVSE